MPFLEIRQQEQDVRLLIWDVNNPIRPLFPWGYSETIMFPHCEARFNFRVVQGQGQPGILRGLFNYDFEFEGEVDDNMRVIVTTSPYYAPGTHRFTTAIIAPEGEFVQCTEEFELGPWSSGAKIFVEISFVRGCPQPPQEHSPPSSAVKRGPDTPAVGGSPKKKPRVTS